MKGSIIFRLDGAKFFSLAKSLSKHYEKNPSLSFVWIDPSPFPSVSISFVSLTQVFFLFFFHANVLFVSLFCFTYSLTSLSNPAGNYLFIVNNRNTRTRCEICSKLTIKTPGRLHWRRSGVFIVNFEHISTPCFSVSIVSFEHVIVGWEVG